MANQLLMALLPIPFLQIFCSPQVPFRLSTCWSRPFTLPLLLFLAFHGFIIPVLMSTGLDFRSSFVLGLTFLRCLIPSQFLSFPLIRLMLRKQGHLSLFILLGLLTIL